MTFRPGGNIFPPGFFYLTLDLAGGISGLGGGAGGREWLKAVHDAGPDAGGAKQERVCAKT